MATSKDFSRSVVAASDELKDIYCEPCVEDGKQNEAEGFCVDCSEYMCGPCYRNHIRYKAFKQHVLQDKENIPLHVKKACVKDACVKKCSIHTTKVVEYFCKSCDTLGCRACIAVNHRQCKNVDHIPDIVKDIEKSEEFTNVLMVLDKKLETVKEKKKTISSNSTEIDVVKGKAKTIMTHQRNKMKLFFDQLVADMNKRIEDLDRENQDTLTAETSLCDSVKDDIETIKTDIETKLKDGQNCEMFIAMKNAKPKAQELIKKLEKLSEGSKLQSCILAPSLQIKKVIENTSEICRFVQSLKYVGKIVVHTKKDNKTPWIFDLVIVQDRYLAFTDNTNKLVKIVETSMNVSEKSKMSFDCTDIWSITSMSDDKIAVNIGSENGNQVQIISVSKKGSLRKGHLINIDGLCHGLAYSRGNIFITQDKQIKILDIQGKIKETLRTDYSSGCRGIAVSPDNETIYITNSGENAVTSMTLDGRIKATYKDLLYPGSVAIDNDGMVYVCGSGCIHLLTEDLLNVQIIKGVDGLCITYSSTDNKLYVGNRDVIKVYEI